jgi:beta-barrel assembly-enhancing protease
VAPEPPAPAPTRPPLRLPAWLAPALGAGVVVIGLVAGVVTLVGGLGAQPVDSAAARRAVDLWLAAPGGPGKVRTDDVAAAVAATGAGIAAPLQARLDGRTPRFLVVDDDGTTRAMALPDGTVVVTTGMLRRLIDESQLAAILAHGLAHVVNGDIDDAVVRHRAASAIADVAALPPGTPAPPALVGALNDVASTTFSAAEERDADDVMMEALATAGWSTGGLSATIADLGAKGARKRAAWLVQHPESGDRAEARARARKDGRVNAPEFATRIRGPLDRPAAPTTAKPAR